MQPQKTVFISYRRTNFHTAMLVYQNLRLKGYDAFLDSQSLESGDFSQSLLNQIAARAHFVVILTPSALERCVNPDDWVRKEIEYAIHEKRNIVPLLFEGFKFEEVKHYLVSDSLKMLPNYNGLLVPNAYFNEAMTRLCSNQYLARDIDTILHPIAAVAAAAAAAVQAKTDAEPAPTPEQLEIEKLFESGYRKLRLMSDFNGAIKDLTQVIKLNPEYVEAYHWRGRAYWNKEDKSKALKDMKMAVGLKPDDQRVNIIRSAIAEVENDFDLALAEAEVGVRLNPNYDEAYFRRGNAHKNKNNHGRAIEDYSEAIRLNEEYGMAYLNRGLEYAKIHSWDKAISDYERALRITPNSWKLKFNMRLAKIGKLGILKGLFS